MGSLVSPGTHLQLLQLGSVARRRSFNLTTPTTHIITKMLRSIFVLFTVLLFIISSLASPLDLGLGGVYNSPAANEYWARRFGGIFGDNFRGLAALQANINAQAHANRAVIP